MGLETVTYISDFVVTNPVGSTDQVSELDDHIRRIKTGVKNTFPNITGPVTGVQSDLNLLTGAAAAGVTTTKVQYLAAAAGALYYAGGTDIAVADGGTGAGTAAGARTNLGAAASGANTDITSLGGLTTDIAVADGGTGAGTAAGARTNLGAAASGANTDITSLGGLTTAITVAQIDGGALQGYIHFGAQDSTGSFATYKPTGVGGSGVFRINIPASASTLTMGAYMSRIAGVTGEAKIVVNGTSSNVIGPTTGALAWYDGAVVDVSAMAGWVECTIQIRDPGSTTTIDGAGWAFS